MIFSCTQNTDRNIFLINELTQFSISFFFELIIFQRQISSICGKFLMSGVDVRLSTIILLILFPYLYVESLPLYLSLSIYFIIPSVNEVYRLYINFNVKIKCYKSEHLIEMIINKLLCIASFTLLLIHCYTSWNTIYSHSLIG